jgi:predicted ferric reductase
VSEHLAWYVARSTGIVTWGLLIASMLWGFLYATRLLGRRARPWWLLGVHRFLGALATAFVIVHVLALIADSYTTFRIVDVLVPFASAWKPIPVALGVVGLYILLAVELTSLAQRHLPRKVWRQIHLASYGLFAFATLHALSAGTDVRAVLVGGVALGVGVVVVLLSALAWVARSEADEPRSSASAAAPVRRPGRARRTGSPVPARVPVANVPRTVAPAAPPRRSVPFAG